MKLKTESLVVYDKTIDRIDLPSFASFIAFISIVVLKCDDIELEGFDKNISDYFSELNLFGLRDALESHLSKRLHIVNQYVLKSKKLDSQIAITYYDNDKLIVQHLYGSDYIIEKISNFQRSWGVFGLEF